MQIECVHKGAGYHLEGPHWDDVTKTLLFVDIVGRSIFRYNPVTKATTSVNIGKKVGAVVPTKSGRILANADLSIGYVDWETGNFETVVDLESDDRQIRFNDAKCDPVGRFWAGTMGFEDAPTGLDERYTPAKGSLYCLHPDKTLVTHLQNVDISNGLAWTSNHKTMYYIDSMQFGVDAFDYDINTGSISNRRRVISIPESSVFPDGMCIDGEDMLWVAHFNGAAVKRFNPNNGELLQTVTLPTDVITSCCWGGEEFDELYVTTSKLFLSEDQLKTQDAGSLFRITGLGVRGVKGNVYNDTL